MQKTASNLNNHGPNRSQNKTVGYQKLVTKWPRLRIETISRVLYYFIYAKRLVPLIEYGSLI